MNASGQAYLTHTVVDGRFAIRMAIGSVLTERRHVQAAWQAIRDLAAGRRLRPATSERVARPDRADADFDCVCAYPGIQLLPMSQKCDDTYPRRHPVVLASG